MNGVWNSGRGMKVDDEQCEGFGDQVCPQKVHMQKEATTSWEVELTKYVQPVTRGVGGGTINGGVSGYSRWFWWALYLRVRVERHMDLEIGLVEKQDEEVEEGLDLGSE